MMVGVRPRTSEVVVEVEWSWSRQSLSRVIEAR
jgi:hypothetical protein